MKKFLALLHARNLEFYRDRASLSWNLLFPVLIVVGFVFAFSDDDRFLYKVGVYGTDTAWQETPWGQIEHIEWVPVDELEHGIEAVRYHQLDLFVATDAPGRYWVNEDSAKGYILEELFTGRTDNQLHREPVTGRKVRYLDWVLPGILGMNMMFGSLFGVGYVIVRYRKNGVLKRLQATPVTPLEFLTSQVLSRLSILLVTAVVIYVGCDLFLDFVMRGAYLDLLIIGALGSMCLISLGLLVSSRTASEELAGGLLNFATWPMMFLSGVWFSLEGAHPALRQLATLLPLTHIVGAARDVMIEGAGLMDVWPSLAALCAMTATFVALAALLFRWNKD